MLIARDSEGNIICARCGKREGEVEITRDHFIPKSYVPAGLVIHNRDKLVTLVDGEEAEVSNYVGLCRQCNSYKGEKIVANYWYKYLTEEDQKKLFYMHKWFSIRNKKGNILHDAFKVYYVMPKETQKH